MIQFLSTRFLMIRLWLLDCVTTGLGLANASKAALRKAENMLNGMKSNIDFLNSELETAARTIKTQEETIRRIDREASLDVRSNLELLNFEAMGEIIWIKVADDRMLRYDVFNQIRDWMTSHKPHSILMVTGTNVAFDKLTEEDIQRSHLRRMTKEEIKALEEGGQPADR
jgi:hypothetical protein